MRRHRRPTTLIRRDQKLQALDSGTCDNPQVISAAPQSITADIAAAKNAAVIRKRHDDVVAGLRTSGRRLAA